VVGTYSTVYVAAPMIMHLGLRRETGESAAPVSEAS
jgi:preprotein translocase subunit SecF